MMSPLTLRRWNAFFRQKRAIIGLSFFMILFFFSMSAEIWSNHRPLLMIRKNANHEKKVYFPVFFNYVAEEFGVTDTFVVDYRELLAKDQEKGLKTFAFFPINRWDPYIQTSDVMVGPSSSHLLGTDSLGRDVFARLIYGIRVSLSYGLLFWVFSFAIGITVGSVQGYFAGRIDFVTERIKELVEILPFLSVVILVNGLVKSQSFWVTLSVVVLFSWVTIASQLRAQFLTLRKRDFCEAARAAGAFDRQIIFKHILPNALTPILTFTPFAISGGIATLAVLDYLGFGMNPPTPSIGELLQQGRAYITNAWWLLVAPTVALSLMLISINLVGESLRQAFDPRKS